ncbi:Aspartate carbamoyltransferase [Candidatus Gugararchaeum adminiculabundum]|nr:Aspartate carbamoyltransferase [Candidatus Gugararchaeum adminiculabundum]
MKKKDLISIRDLGKDEIENLFSLAKKMEGAAKSGKKFFNDKIVFNLFFEPSTRTNLSFQAAAARLGCTPVAFNPQVGSVQKGETFSDTIKIIDGYCDVIVIRHALEGSARFASQIAEHPVINAGDGGNQHPTQTLIDLYTISKIKGKIKGLSVHLVGDLKHARAMRSLLYGLGMFGAEVTLTAPVGLEMDPAIINEVKEKFGTKIRLTGKVDLKDADVLYVCRVQKERFADPYEAEKIKKEFRINPEYLERAKDDMIILHPLPKIDEIPEEVDKSKHAKYFEQARNGIPIRMAVLYTVLGGSGA